MTKNVVKAYVPSQLELDGLLANVKENNIQRWVMLHFSYYAGLRAKEISELTVGNIHDGNEIPKRTQLPTKGGGVRSVSLANEKLRSAISTWYKVSNLSTKPINAPLFSNPQGAKFSSDGVVKQFIKVYEPFNKDRDTHNKFKSHSGRRYFATVLGNTAGITTRQMMELGGWKSPDVALQYVDVNHKQLDDLVERAEL